MQLLLEKHTFKILLILILAVHALALFCDIFNGDSALYASIAKNMTESGDWLILNSIMQENWIDKPHFAFWIWAVFIKVFGNTNFGFKFPSLLSLLILLRYLFLFTKKYYDDKTAWTAILILSSSLHIFISTNDVRIDIFLITFMMAAIYHFQNYLTNESLIQLLIGTAFTSIAVMTKGIYVLLPIGLSIIIPVILAKNYKRLIHPHWIIAIIIFILGISPALYALKVQFENFNDTQILGQKASNYLQFFFWDSQFGRFNSNLGQVQSNGDPFFYLHTILWAFAPCSILLFLTFFLKKNPLKEWITITCFTTMLMIISISKTQLSHHVLILLPFLSIIIAILFRKILWRMNHKFFLIFVYTLLFAVSIASIFFTHYVLGEWMNTKLAILFIITVFLIILSFLNVMHRILIVLVSISIFMGLFLNLILYPEILNYQAGRKVSLFVLKNSKYNSIEEFYANISLLNFYSPVIVKNTKVKNLDRMLKMKEQLLFSNEYGVKYLLEKKVNFKILDTIDEYRTTLLSSHFLNNETRKNALEKIILIEINPH